jgi:hypothetical protein
MAFTVLPTTGTHQLHHANGPFVQLACTLCRRNHNSPDNGPFVQLACTLCRRRPFCFVFVNGPFVQLACTLLPPTTETRQPRILLELLLRHTCAALMATPACKLSACLIGYTLKSKG